MTLGKEFVVVSLEYFEGFSEMENKDDTESLSKGDLRQAIRLETRVNFQCFTSLGYGSHTHSKRQ